MWYLISCSWLKSWAKFTNGHPPPGPIDNACLLQVQTALSSHLTLVAFIITKASLNHRPWLAG
jgi:hypothetical protein